MCYRQPKIEPSIIESWTLGQPRARPTTARRARRAAIDRSLQRRIPFAIPRVDCRPAIQQRPRDLYMASPGRHVQRGRPRDAAARVHIGARLARAPSRPPVLFPTRIRSPPRRAACGHRRLVCWGPCPVEAAMPPPRGNLRPRRSGGGCVLLNGAFQALRHAPPHPPRKRSHPPGRTGPSAPAAQRTPPAWTRTAVRERRLRHRGPPRSPRWRHLERAAHSNAPPVHHVLAGALSLPAT